MNIKQLFKTIVLVQLFSFLTIDISAQQIILEEAFPEVEVSSLLGMEVSDENSSYIYLVSRSGLIYRVDTAVSTPQGELWLDISSRVRSGGERGLLGLAFHPDFPENRTFYVNYTADDGDLFTVISRFEVEEGEDQQADPESEEILLEFEQPYINHNGGDIAFGPDGYLYIASGDGGSGGDPENNGQDTTTLLGAILRIDVDTEQGYNVPPDNPFVGSQEGADEIYAWGLRNPWRFSFDRETGDLWVADVGQNAWESIYIVENGKNYGWNIVEGSHCFPIGSTCDKTGLEIPLFEYNHDEGDQSITGGFVYRGSNNPALYGKYVYGDFISGRVWALDYDTNQEEVLSNVELINSPRDISSFGQGVNGELYLLDLSSGKVYEMIASPVAPEILSPEDGGTETGDHSISWTEIQGTENYQIQVASDADFNSIEFQDEVSTISVNLTLDDGIYYARVRAENSAGVSDYSEPVNYTVESSVSINEVDERPAEFVLHPATPNPFNPATQIAFELPQQSHVLIEVYSMLGQRVTILTNETYSAGIHRITFDASSLSSGIYLIRARMGQEVFNRKVTLLK